MTNVRTLIKISLFVHYAFILVQRSRKIMIRSRAQRKKRQSMKTGYTEARGVQSIDTSRMFWLNDLDELKRTLRTSGWDERYVLRAAEAGSESLFIYLIVCMQQNGISNFSQDFKDHLCQILLRNGARNQRYNDCLFKWFFKGLVFQPWMVEYAHAHQNVNARKMIEAFLSPSMN